MLSIIRFQRGVPKSPIKRKAMLYAYSTSFDRFNESGHIKAKSIYPQQKMPSVTITMKTGTTIEGCWTGMNASCWTLALHSSKNYPIAVATYRNDARTAFALRYSKAGNTRCYSSNSLAHKRRTEEAPGHGRRHMRYHRPRNSPEDLDNILDVYILGYYDMHTIRTGVLLQNASGLDQVRVIIGN